MSSVKTFPIVLSKEEHQSIKKAAEDCNMPMKTFIMIAIAEKIQKERSK